MFILMGSVNIFLNCVMRQRKKALLLGNLSSDYNFRQEFCTLKITLFLFELSYLSRFIYDQFLYKVFYDCNNQEKEAFAFVITFDACLYLDVLPFIGLLLFHLKNFR